MILELFGLSGSGKSTVARRLDTTGKAVRIRITSTPELLWRSMYYIAQNPIASMHQLRYLFLYSGSLPLFYTKFMNLFLHHAAKRQKAETTKGTVVIDQGHLQNLLSLFERPVSEDIMNAYLGFLPQPDEVWVCEVPEEERSRRLNLRDHEGRAGESFERRAMREESTTKNFSTAMMLFANDKRTVIRNISSEHYPETLTL